MKILCLGNGFTSGYLARNFSGEHDVAFLTRSPDEARAAGLRLYESASERQDFGLPDMILDTIPALFRNDVPMTPAHLETTREILASAPNTPIVHISSTSVYPEGGRAAEPHELPSFNENTPAEPSGARGEKRLRWEEHLRSFFPDLRVVRAGGIYGPERSLALRFRAGDFSRTDSGNRVVSRIHVHDLARLCIAAATNPSAPRMLIAVDREPSPNRRTFSFLEDLLGIRIPGNWREGDCLGRSMRSRFAEDLLGGVFRFPDFRVGFRHSLEVSA